MKDAKWFVGPSKRMQKALEAEGLKVEWPAVVRSEGNLALEGSFSTGPGWEKLVSIDLREKPLQTKHEVDEEIAHQLEKAYAYFDRGEEFDIVYGAKGAPDSERLWEDIREQDERLERFSRVARAVADGKRIPADKPEEIEIGYGFAKEIQEVLLAAAKKVGKRNLKAQMRRVAKDLALSL